MYRFLFPFSLFLSASLLFVIQPMVAKVLLPVYGGTPAVWTVCMFFFQLVMLVGYSYAWVLSRLSGSYQWRIVHATVCLMSLFSLPLAFMPESAKGVPEIQILAKLFVELGLPLLVIGSSAPLLQYAFSQTKGRRAADPYFLYVASNVGSLVALLSYPWIIERFTGVNQQFYGWNMIYLVYLGFLLYLFLAVHYEPIAQITGKAVKIAWSLRAKWVYLSFIPCSLMLGVTFYITTDIAATPLFWVLPLALYLLSFVLTFASKPMISHAWVMNNGLFLLVFPILGFIVGANQVHAMPLIVANLVGFFVLALLCHGELICSRPPAHQLTTFYFCLSLGGVLAGLFNGLVAPRLFSHAYEYPLAMLFALLCFPKTTFYSQSAGGLRGWLIPCGVLGLLLFNFYLPDNAWGNWLKIHHVIEILALLLIMVWPGNVYRLFFSMAILFVFIFMPWFKTDQILSQKRNFYGVKQVFSRDGMHVLMSQSTLHGFQFEEEMHPTDGARGYYAAVYPVVQQLQMGRQSLHAMVLGLGTGIMACQFRAQDKLTMVEIDEQVIDIAKDSRLFTYLRDCPPELLMLRDDGLLAVTQTADASYDVLVMDAFSSDAIPVHLLTLEAFDLYKKKITTDGVILVNISNRHLRILPVLTGAGRALEMIVLQKFQASNERLGQLASEWALLTTNERLASYLMVNNGWRFVAEPETQLWTNDYSNLIPLIKW